MSEALYPPEPETCAVWRMRLLSAAVLLLLVAYTPLSRTQEARVLECAREMYDRPISQWAVPRLNGEVRLHKPPLAYWLAAGSFRLFGVSTWSGRLPFALAAWVTLAIVHDLGRRLGGAQTGMLSGGIMLSMLMFQRYGRLAETDPLVLLWLTLAMYALVRAALIENRIAWWWHHVSAAAMAATAMSKGPPAVFVLMFVPCAAWAAGRRRLVLHWLASGAPLTAAVLGLPWWIFALSHPAAQTLAREASDLATGRDHGGYFYEPLGYVLKATLPWTALLGAAAWTAWHSRRTTLARLTAVWSAAIVIVHMFLPQKQEHYLLPVLPPLALLGGWGWNICLRSGDRRKRFCAAVVGASLAAVCIGAAVVVVLATRTSGRLPVLAAALAAPAVAALVFAMVRAYRAAGDGLSVEAAIASAALATAAITGASAASDRHTMADVASAFRQRCGDGPYAFYAIDSVPLIFEMRRTIPLCEDERSLLEAARRNPQLAVICETNREQSRTPPPPFVPETTLTLRKKKIAVYRIPESQRAVWQIPPP